MKMTGKEFKESIVKMKSVNANLIGFPEKMKFFYFKLVSDFVKLRGK